MAQPRRAQILANELRNVVGDSKLGRDAARELERMDALLNNPSIDDFLESVRLERGHQLERWGIDHDSEKFHEDWFWLIGYLAGKALHAVRTNDRDKALHHTISTAAVLSLWHDNIKGDAR